MADLSIGGAAFSLAISSYLPAQADLISLPISHPLENRIQLKQREMDHPVKPGEAGIIKTRSHLRSAAEAARPV